MALVIVASNSPAAEVATRAEMAADKRGVFGWTALNAINRAKLTTVATIALCVLQHGGLNNMRQTLYVALHGSYLLYWYIHQYAVPEWQPFTDPAGLPVIFMAFTLIGVGYALPVFLAFSNPHDISPYFALLCIMTNVLGTAINAGSDWYKAGAKAAGGSMVKTGPYTWSLRPNYLGDWLRYLSFAMVTGRPLALLLPAFVVLTNVGQLPQIIKEGKERYGDKFVDYASKVPAVVPGLWPAMSSSAAASAAKKKGG